MAKTIRVTENIHTRLEFWRDWYGVRSFSEAIEKLSNDTNDEARKAWQEYAQAKEVMQRVAERGSLECAN